MSASTTSGAGHAARAPPAHLPQFAAMARHRAQRGAASRRGRAAPGPLAAARGQRLEQRAQALEGACARRHSSALIVSKSASCAAPRGRSRSAAHRPRGFFGRRRLGSAGGISGWCGNSASPRRRFSGGGGRCRSLACTLGSSMAHHAAGFRSGSFQKSWKAWSKSSRCSARSTRQAASVSWKSRRLSRPATCSACSASCDAVGAQRQAGGGAARGRSA